MPFVSLVRLKIRQVTSGDTPRGLVKFLLPDFLVGVFLGVQAASVGGGDVPLRITIVSAGVVVFTLIAETRKLFFNGGDAERFYFVHSTAESRLASLVGIMLLDAAVAAAIFIPAAFVSSAAVETPVPVLLSLLVSAFASAELYLVALLFLASFPGKSTERFLTYIQVVAALALLGIFQLSTRTRIHYSAGLCLAVVIALFVLTSLLFATTPVSERLVAKLGEGDFSGVADLLASCKRFKRPLLVKSEEEEAGLMFFLANLLRNSSFRLSTIAVAATPVMVAVYWTMQGIGLLTLNPRPGIMDADFVAPMASLLVSGIVSFYFIAQNTLSSKDHEAGWIFDSQGGFDKGRFVLGARKGLLAAVHVPVTLLVFSIAIFVEPFASAAAAAATYYFVVHVAASWFSVMQRRMPFSVPFTRLGAVETLNLSFMFAYSFLVSVALAFVYGDPDKLLLVNLFAFILIGMLEYFSAGIVNRRMRAVA